MKRKITASLLLLSLIGTLFVMPGMAEEPENLMADHNPDFEEFLFDGIAMKEWTGVDMETQLLKGTEANPAHSGDYFVNIPVAGDVIHTKSIALEPETNYELTFYSRSSARNSGLLDLRYYYASKMYNVYCDENYIPWVNGEQFFQGYFGTAKTTTEESMEWRKVCYNFRTPPHIEAGILNIYNKTGDSYLCLDDFKLIKKEKDNYFPNGDITGVREDGDPSSWNVVNGNGINYEIIEENGEKIYHQSGGGNTSILVGMPLKQGRWKLTFDYKNSKSRSYVPSIYIGSNGISSAVALGFVAGRRNGLPYLFDKNMWQTYEVYITVPEQDTVSTNTDGFLFQDFRVELGWDDAFIKNIYLVPDETSLEFDKFVDLEQNTANLTEKKTVINKKVVLNNIGSALTADEMYQVHTKAHYIPKTAGEEKYKLISALYKTVDGKKQLCNIYYKEGSASGGLVSDVTDTVSVPKDGAEYSVTAYLWSSSALGTVLTEKTEIPMA